MGDVVLSDQNRIDRYEEGEGSQKEVEENRRQHSEYWPVCRDLFSVKTQQE